jgi:tetratricopeptide (TPR) repeat protein
VRIRFYDRRVTGVKQKVSLCCIVAALFILSQLPASGQDSGLAGEELQRGVEAYKAHQYARAAQHFKNAVGLDPELLDAQLYLATAYANQYVPGSREEENIALGEKAIAEYQRILDRDPDNVGAISGTASLYFQMQRMDEARRFYSRQVSLVPDKPEPYYSIAVIDWKRRTRGECR